MTPFVFQKYWLHNFQNLPPLGYILREVYADAWFRIHNLPNAKRYAENEDEMQAILHRQNSIIEHLLGEDARIYLVSGTYIDVSIPNSEPFVWDVLKAQQYTFQAFDPFDLHAISHRYHDENIFFKPVYAKTAWRRNKHNTLLKAIANDEMRALFVVPVGKIIIAPYDGGVDFIIPNDRQRLALKANYQDWCSQREDGL